MERTVQAGASLQWVLAGECGGADRLPELRAADCVSHRGCGTHPASTARVPGDAPAHGLWHRTCRIGAIGGSTGKPAHGAEPPRVRSRVHAHDESCRPGVDVFGGGAVGRNASLGGADPGSLYHLCGCRALPQARGGQGSEGTDAGHHAGATAFQSPDSTCFASRIQSRTISTGRS